MEISIRHLIMDCLMAQWVGKEANVSDGKEEMGKQHQNSIWPAASSVEESLIVKWGSIVCI